LGRSFWADEDRPGGDPVVMLSHELWAREFGSSHSVAGQTLTLNDKVYTVIGVLPAGFRFDFVGPVVVLQL
jgi:putative ABC transport system permease protein